MATLERHTSEAFIDEIKRLRRSVAWLQAERDAYRTALEWAVEQGGYRLGYDAPGQPPLGIWYDGGTIIRVQTPEELSPYLDVPEGEA